MVRFARKEEELEVVMMLLEVLVMMPLENDTLASCRKNTCEWVCLLSPTGKKLAGLKKHKKHDSQVDPPRWQLIRKALGLKDRRLGQGLPIMSIANCDWHHIRGIVPIKSAPPFCCSRNADCCSHVP